MPLKSCRNLPNRGRKPSPSRRKPACPPTRQPSSKDVTTHWVRFSGRSCVLQSAFCNLQASLPAPRMPAISRHDFPSQTKSDSANSCFFSGRMRFRFPETQEDPPSLASGGYTILVYHNVSDLSSCADKIIMPRGRREGPLPQSGLPPAGILAVPGRSGGAEVSARSSAVDARTASMTQWQNGACAH